MSKTYFLGIDIGTYESKGALVDENAVVVASYAVPHIMESPQPGYAEHDAEQTWWGDFVTISNQLIRSSGIRPSAIAAVGCSTIGPCCLPVDRSCNPLRKAILYGVDVRAGKEIQYLQDTYGRDAIFEKCGTDVTSQSAAAKILWIKNNEPDVYNKTAAFITGQTYLVAKLTGNYVIDRYTASTFVPIYSVRNQDWDYDNLDLFCTPDQLASCKWSHEVAGYVTAEAAGITGIPAGTPVITGTADASAEAFSAGVLDPGDMLLMFGSSVFIIHVVQDFTVDKRLWSGPYLFPGTYAVAAGMSTTGTLTRWFRDQFAKDLVAQQDSGGANAYAALMDEAQGQAIPPGSGGLIVLPYWSGERTPIHDPAAKGVIFGLNLLHTRAHIYQACLEGVGYGIAQHFDIFDQRQMGTRKVMAVGGGVKNPLWLQIVADICGKNLNIAQESLGAAYGDALLAALGVGFYADSRAVANVIRHKASITPDPAQTQAYAPYKDAYTKLYHATKELMHTLGG